MARAKKPEKSPLQNYIEKQELLPPDEKLWEKVISQLDEDVCKTLLSIFEDGGLVRVHQFTSLLRQKRDALLRADGEMWEKIIDEEKMLIKSIVRQ